MRIDPVVAATAVLLIVFVITLIVRDQLIMRDQMRKLPESSLTPSQPQLDNNLEQVKLLFDYTKFHITVYGTIAALLLTASTSIGSSLNLPRIYIIAAVSAILVAGLAAGVVAASMPESTNRVGFWDQLGGPYKSRLLTIRSWTFVEHTFFWTAVFFVVMAFAYAKHAPTTGFEITLSVK
ncbi:MAG TPA: hypothetical protein VNN08_08550 [Thermoanaerobaculia bacterium]|nr:hypothetical protein [Thermoanaerobaculia bacterium]